MELLWVMLMVRVTSSQLQVAHGAAGREARTQREEKEVLHLLHAQQRILGKKTVEDFAQLKLIRRESVATRSRSLHCNGKTLNSSRKSKGLDPVGTSDAVPVRTDSLPRRPMSAKPVRQSQYRSSVGHSARLSSEDEAELLGNTPSKKYSKKKRIRKTIDRKAGRLMLSKSTPVLSDKAEHSESIPVCKKINIIVNMRNLQLIEEPNTPSGSSPPSSPIV
ncbi:hypothetical protein PInf_002904 [Phytophthora infestans]|nr:hypothetical protein PInf_002904 [Phytophthora infestans]